MTLLNKAIALPIETAYQGHNDIVRHQIETHAQHVLMNALPVDIIMTR